MLAASWECRVCCAKSSSSTCCKGLKVTFRYQDPKEIYTEQYPLGAAAGGRALSRSAPAQRQS